MKARYTPRAFADLEAIFRFIYEQNPTAALRVRDAISNLISGLATFPAKGQKADKSTVRTLLAGGLPYRIFYRIEENGVSILHIRHTARKSIQPGDL